ncbi:hypothetical protein KAH55_14010 [bacterium]|nr:hypothetical protein [bacterium]
MRVKARDFFAFQPNELDQIISFRTETTFQVSVSGGELEVKSDPFTPNDDGINEEVCFNCENFKLIAPLVKIFDLWGKVVKALRECSAGRKFYWNGPQMGQGKTNH